MYPNDNLLYLAPLDKVLDVVVDREDVAHLLSSQEIDYGGRYRIRLTMPTIRYGKFYGGRQIEAFTFNAGDTEIRKYLLTIDSIKYESESIDMTSYAGIGNPKMSVPGIKSVSLEAVATPMPLRDAEKFVCDVRNIRYWTWREALPHEDPTRR